MNFQRSMGRSIHWSAKTHGYLRSKFCADSMEIFTGSVVTLLCEKKSGSTSYKYFTLVLCIDVLGNMTTKIQIFILSSVSANVFQVPNGDRVHYALRKNLSKFLIHKLGFLAFLFFLISAGHSGYHDNSRHSFSRCLF